MKEQDIDNINNEDLAFNINDFNADIKNNPDAVSIDDELSDFYEQEMDSDSDI